MRIFRKTYKPNKPHEDHKPYEVLWLIALLLLLPLGAAAQITISGKVYGGARQANVGGHTFVRIGAQKHNVIIDAVYGGNDISGTIGSSTKPAGAQLDEGDHIADLGSYNAFVRTDAEATGKHLFIGQLFGGGYGNYEYSKNAEKWDVLVPRTVWDPTANENKGDYVEVTQTLTSIDKPELARTYVDIHGGTFGYVYGGGDSVTVTRNTQICIYNESTPLDINGADGDLNENPNDDVISDDALRRMNINTEYFDRNANYNISRLFGGNNKAPMAIMPTWHLQAGKIEYLYSGGNRGAMTSQNGLLLEINPEAPDDVTDWAAQQEIKHKLKIENVFGGCRMADVMPQDANGVVQTPGEISGYAFPNGLSARVLIRGGDINNVYGGNDVTGRVYGGNAIGVRTTIRGDIYGGGNGSYPYTDNYNLRNDLKWGDFCYNTDNTITASTSVDALNDYRPNAEQVSIRVYGADADHPTIVHGSIYLGGNCATLKTEMERPRVELKIGSNSIVDKVFLGNNGYNMVQPDILTQYKYGVNLKDKGNVTTDTSADGYTDYSMLDLTDSDTFKKYMKGCELTLMPAVKCDGDDATDEVTYNDYSSYIGSLYCGGNVGSMNVAGKTQLFFRHNFIIYDKVVGGSNDANVPVKYRDDDTQHADPLNATFEGGLIGTPENDNNKLEMNFTGLKIQPKRWVMDGNEYAVNDKGSHYLEWNTISASTGNNVPPETTLTKEEGEDYELSDDNDIDRRLKGGNVYGGCYNSGHVNGNVIINLETSIVDRKGEFAIFDQVIQNEGEATLYGNDDYQIIERRSGVLLDEQGMDVLGKALNVFGGGYGADTEIWGSTTINLKAGYTFQIFGGGERGVVGKANDPDPNAAGNVEQCSFNGKTYEYNPKYTCTINVRGNDAGVYRGHADDKDDMAEAEFIYGGAFFSPICGNTVINLGNGRVFNTFAGSCNGDILGHTETYVGRNYISENEITLGYPWVRDHIYGGNDLGGRIQGQHNFYDRVQTASQSKVYNPKNLATPNVTNASAYIEYIQGRIDYIFGGCYGVYDYTDPHYKDYTYTCTKTETGGETTYSYTDDGSNANNVGQAKTSTGFIKPRLENAFINFRPNSNAKNAVTRVYGAGQGYSHDTDRDVMQNRSYILIDIPQDLEYFQNLVVFGAGDLCGLGMATNLYTTTSNANLHSSYKPARDNGISYDDAKDNDDGITASAVIDLARGTIRNVYGGSFSEGITRRSIVNVPVASAIHVNNIFGGAYGMVTNNPCDVFEATVNYDSEDAAVAGAIYGGNNNERRTIYGKVNIYSPVYTGSSDPDTKEPYLAKVYGAGFGGNTWSEYTEVNLKKNPDNTKPGAKVYEAYGGGQQGKVHNVESVQVFMNTYKPLGQPADAWSLGYDYYIPTYSNNSYDYVGNTKTNLGSDLVREAEIDDRYDTEHEHFHAIPEKFRNRYNANVIINEGATVTNYVYGGGYGADAVVAGTTYVALLGGTVEKDIYAAGTSGSVEDLHGAGLYDKDNNPDGFVASTNVYIQGGTVRNVYGGGWRGSVGHHTGIKEDTAHNITADPNSTVGDIEGEAHVVIGNLTGETNLDGIPAITRNVYGGGEGGAIYGPAYVTFYNGYVGYRYKNTSTTNTPNYEYVPENDDLPDDGALEERGGNIFGGGYVANSYVDYTDVNMYGGVVRGSLFGGGEVGPVGRGTVHTDSLTENHIRPYIRNGAAIYKGGETHVDLYGGHVMRNVFGGGRGYDNWNGEGWMSDIEKETMDLSSKGYVFGSTEVHIHGGEVGTTENSLLGFGNVFGGGDEGFVYSATGTKHGTPVSDTEYQQGFPTGGGGYYYEDNEDHEWVENDKSTWIMTPDCTVSIKPFCKVTGEGLSIDRNYDVGELVEVEALNMLRNRKADNRWGLLDTKGITIHNAVFAGGNITEGSDLISASTVTVYGNAGASLRDVYNCDLITIGNDDVGGIYGDGNLTLVDGFREIHIDNYGTDYYSLDPTMDMDDDAYKSLTDRQKAYYQLKYVTHTKHTYRYYECNETHVSDGHTYKRGEKVTSIPSGDNESYWVQGIKDFQIDDQIDEGEWLLMDTGEQSNWEVLGVCSKYAGRPLNTIQRADMCGVFGSRIVLKGAEDRVPNIIDYATYTINRVDEISLNRRVSVAPDDASDPTNREHGNYFGIYNSVKFLGNLTSDVFFTENATGYTAADGLDLAVRRTSVSEGSTAPPADGHTTYYQWKADNPASNYRNNGISYNKVALASGVYLEIKREEGESTGVDDWGFITGVVELDLINVMPGMGGGYVYARNEHGTQTWHGNPNNSNYWGHILLLEENMAARTYRRFEYTESSKTRIETSGNFVHNTKQIIDDCYPNGGMYNPTTAAYTDSPAHYWFIKGSIYVYDQYISAYTGSANAYAKKVELPLTISAASNGRMTLREVQPNYYAYYEKHGNKIGDPTIQNADTVFVANNITYHLNEPISYWAYNILDEGDKSKFVKETYVTIQACTVGEGANAKTIPAGYVMLPGEYSTLMSAALGEDTTDDGVDNPVKYVLDDQGKKVPFTYVFRPSNNLSHDTGFILTYEVNNPNVWNHYYTKEDLSDKLVITDYHDESSYLAAPTFTPSQSGVYGQHEVKVGQIINGNVVTAYSALTASDLAGKGDQATVEAAWVAKEEVEYTYNGNNKVMNVGATISQTEYNSIQPAEKKAAFERAQVCTNLLEFSETDFVFNGKVLTSAEIATLITKVIEKNEYVDDGDGTAIEKAQDYLEKYISDAYICTDAGWYGGTTYSDTKAYRALETFCDMQKSERDQFIFNYDALDLLIDPTYGGGYGFKPQYDGYMPGTTQEDIDNGDASPQYLGSTPLDPQLYSTTQQIDYEAEFIGFDKDNPNEFITYTKADGETTVTIREGDPWLLREAYESIPNEKRHYTPIIVTDPGYYYVVKSPFIRGDVPYSTGQVLDDEVFSSLTDLQKQNVVIYNFKTDHVTQKKNDQNEPLYLDSEGHETTDATGNTPIYVETYYYYCRENYPINQYGMGQPVTTIGGIGIGEGPNAPTTEAKSYSVTDTDNTNDEVPSGVIIAKEGVGSYDDLPNYQKGFAIHGKSPTETSTLYVSSESDIYNLTKERIITVIYLYEYEESDESGENVTPVSERHIINIHIDFKSGTPEIGKLNTPNIVLPGTTIGLETPSVNDGALPITDSGWEIYSNDIDASTHTNGKEYYNNVTPVYWYQNDYWIAYWAESQLGRAYSNSVKFSVANYHDIKKVMDDKDHHYYIDHKDMDYEPKIYINDYSSDGVNGLDILKNLIDLTYVQQTYNNDGDPLPISGGALDGHMPMDTELIHKNSPDDVGTTIQGGAYYEFFLRADQNYTVPSGSDGWTPIASGVDECFSGNFHGYGHTISGITKSLFEHLCGNVYNLGVTGPFTEAGVANSGGGFVENCWIKSTAVSGFAANTKAVFGNPDDDGKTHVVNCYYTEAPKVTDPNNPENEITLSPYYAEGPATPMPERAFYNGTVAYDLNGFYLFKRYCDNSGVGSTVDYEYWKPGQNALQKLTGHYGSSTSNNIMYCSSGVSGIYNKGYVEDRFADGDFRYAGGSIPSSQNERAFVDETDDTKVEYYPIWPDDYLFFGQMLTYGYSEGQPHQDVPSAIVKNNTRLLNTEKSNRVYRAPAYFRSKEIDVAHFNPYAYLAAHSAPKTITDTDLTPAYPNMTAIDFAGLQNNAFADSQGKIWRLGTVPVSVSGGSVTGKPAFYPPLLDDDGLIGVANKDETQNLLVYAPASAPANEGDYANLATYTVLTNYFVKDKENNPIEPVYSTYYGGTPYRCVSIAPTDAIQGHLVQSTKIATCDHLLVDKQDFNCPIAYSFDDNHRMWYQRKPGTYVGHLKKADGTYDTQAGWEGVSIPFEAELVTTDQKGEITHFYEGSEESKNGTHTKIGHEYWLRELFNGGEISSTNPKVYEANMSYPQTVGEDVRTVENTFLWDYYYYETTTPYHQDANNDTYQTYYESPRDYTGYPLLAAAKPYIIGFPGKRYYEFDLSGSFTPTTTSSPSQPARLEVQTISFVSNTKISIGVSDDETKKLANGNEVGVKDNNDYIFKPSYLNNPEVSTGYHAFVLNTENSDDANDPYLKGSRFMETAEEIVASTAFRPFFIKTVQQSQGSTPAPALRYIVFTNEVTALQDPEIAPDMGEDITENLEITVKSGKIVVTSLLRSEAGVQIYNVGGTPIDTYTIKPGETRETSIYNNGVYIVRGANGRFTKKLSVK